MPVAGTLEVADAIVFVVLLFLVASLWLLLQARQPIGGVPIVGVVGVNLIDGMRQNITKLAYSLESFLTWQQSQISQLWASFVSGVMTPALNAIDTAATHEAQFIHAFIVQQVGIVRLAEQDLANYVRGDVNTRLVRLQGQVATDDLQLKTVVVPTLNRTVADVRSAEQTLEDTRGRVQQLEQQLAAAQQQLAVLVAFLPAIRGLTGFESATQAGVIGLQGQQTLSDQQLRDLQAQLAKLLALTGIAALGAVAIENLVRVARDPCSACQGTNLLDLEARLELVETFGET